jgi:hypothetical protein
MERENKNHNLDKSSKLIDEKIAYFCIEKLYITLPVWILAVIVLLLLSFTEIFNEPFRSIVFQSLFASCLIFTSFTVYAILNIQIEKKIQKMDNRYNLNLKYASRGAIFGIVALGFGIFSWQYLWAQRVAITSAGMALIFIFGSVVSGGGSHPGGDDWRSKIKKEVMIAIKTGSTWVLIVLFSISLFVYHRYVIKPLQKTIFVKLNAHITEAYTDEERKDIKEWVVSEGLAITSDELDSFIEKKLNTIKKEITESMNGQIEAAVDDSCDCKEK